MKDTDRKTRLPILEIAELALLTALLVAGKEVLASVPNVHLVMFFILLGVLLYGWKVMYCVAGFVLVEVLIYGLGLWVIMYAFVWPLYTAVAMIFRKNRSPVFWGAFAGMCGLCFGFFCEVPFFFIIGIGPSMAYWVSGLLFDLIHGISNAVIVSTLLMPLYRLIIKTKKENVS